ncbi:MAG TPA: hypothetical protein VD997_11040 [Phycisphaerales bacterium]|nr:hypothetical protein [Phycisphaerales bacterium]
MNEVRRVVRRAAWRLWLQDVFQTLAVTTTISVTAILLARATQQVFGLSQQFAPWWKWGFIGAGAFAIVGAFTWAAIRRRKALKVAVELDERAGLRESLSTALTIQKNDDPWSRAVVDTAEDNAKRVDVKRAIPFHTPPLWPVPIATAAAALLVWFFLPSFDLLGHDKKAAAEEKKREQVTLVKAEIENKDKVLKDMLAKAKVGFVEDKTDLMAPEKKPELNDPEAIKRAAVKKLTDLSNKLEAQKSGEKGAQADAIKEAMKQLKQPGPGPLDEFSKALARGDFNKAQEQLAELTKQMNEGGMDKDKAELTKQQLENLAKQMEQIAQQQKDIEKKLEQQGLDKKSASELAKAAANSPEAMQKALEQAKNLSEAQKKKLMEMAKAMSQCQGQCQNMAQAMSQAAQGMSQEGLSQEGLEGMEALAQELSEAEMLSEDMENLSAALGECKNQLKELGESLGQCEGESECENGGQGKWRAGNTNKQGSGSGGPGNSQGGFSPDAEAADFTLEKKKAKVNTTSGPIIGTRLVNGPQVKGESVAEFSAAVAAGAQETAEAMETQQIPREMQDVVKQYFGRLEAKVKAAQPAPPATDAASKK